MNGIFEVCSAGIVTSLNPWNIQDALKAVEARTGINMVEDEKEVSLKCGMCDADIGSGSEHLKAKWQWNMDTNLILCKRCYSIKSKEYEKRINYCAVCGNKMSFFRYNPKPKWKIDGQLCRRCWDNSNIHWKNQG